MELIKDKLFLVINSATGTVVLNDDTELEVTISGRGDIYFRQPKIRKNTIQVSVEDIIDLIENNPEFKEKLAEMKALNHS